MRRPSLLLSGLLIWAVGPLRVQGKEKKTPPSGAASRELKFHTATFQPGKLGIGADWNSGRVTRVDKGGQGEEKKVKVGMVIDKVDGKNYHESLLDKRIAGSNAYEITFKVLPPPAPPAPPPPPKDGDLPPVPDFKYATVLTPETFKTMVYDQTNGSQADAPKYYPIVMFHVSWCKHCRHALPEYEKAAEMVAEQSKQRRSVLSPRLFLIECDKPPEHKPVCEEHVGSNYPVIKLSVMIERCILTDLAKLRLLLGGLCMSPNHRWLSIPRTSPFSSLHKCQSLFCIVIGTTRKS